MSQLINKHDQLVKKFLMDISVAKEFLTTYLAPEFLAKCDINSLEIESGSYIEEDLITHCSDLVYRLKLKENNGSAYIYCLLEHQSSPDKMMPLRILKYQLAIIQNHLDKYKGKNIKLPIVASMVFYNGEATPYPYNLDITELFADTDAYKQYPLGVFRLVDLTVTEDNDLLQHGKIALLEILLKHIRDRDFNESISLIIKALKVAMIAQVSDSLFNSAFSYLMSAKETEEIQQLIKCIDVELPNLKDNIMTYAEELMQKGVQQGMQKGIQQGMQQGIQKGKQEGKQEGWHEAQLEIAREMLKKGVDQNLVAEITKLSLSQIKTLH